MDNKRPNTIRKYLKIIKRYDELVKIEDNSQFLIPMYFYIQVGQEFDNEPETISRIIANRNAIWKFKHLAS